MNNSFYTRNITLLCFFLTGVTGLVYELVWIRILILSFGSTQFAITTVLTTFMSGLAIGSLIFGRLIDRYKKPLRMFGILEIILGVYCIFTPLIFYVIKTLYLTSFSSTGIQYASFNPNQFLFSFAGIILPATLMGGTLPVLSKYFTLEKEHIGYNIGVLYSINTLGAVLGCTITGFFLLYLFGVKTTIYLAGVLDIIVGTVIVFLSIRGKTYDIPYTKDKTFEIPKWDKGKGKTKVNLAIEKLPINKIVVATFAISGFTALAYEVLWTRVFSLIIGSSIYAFTIMLTTFLFGIGIGSILFAPFIDRRRAPLLWFAILELIIGISAILSVPLYKELPFIFLKLHSIFSQNFWLFSFIQFLLCSAIMIIPTLCMGAIFPTVSRIYTKDIDKIGQSIGNIYFFNTVGAILGSFVGGFIMIPFIGIQRSIILASATNIFLGVLLLTITSLKTFKKVAAAGIITIAFIVFVYNIPSWDRMIMTLGPYVNPLDEVNIEKIKTKEQYGELLFYKEGINAIITVRREADGRTISYQSNGKYEAKSVDSKPGKAWSLLGHIPMLLSKGASNALLVGIGSGITLGSMEQYPLKEIDVVEIEPAVIEVVGYFSAANNNALDDPRVKLHIRDGRNFLLTTQNRYDVIVSAVSDPWITGVSNLFTREYFEELSNKLNHDGIVALWFQNYRISNNDFNIGLNTFASVFPYVSLWFHYSGTSDLIVIGSKNKHSIDMNLLYTRFEDENIRRDLARIEISDPFEILNLFLIGNSDIRSYIGSSKINTDDRPILEFTLPMLLYTDPGRGSNERVQDLLANARDCIPPIIIPHENKEDFYFRLGVTYAQYVFRNEQAISLFERVLDINPEHRKAREYLDAIQGELKK